MCLTALAYSEYATRRLSSHRADCARRQRIRSVADVTTNVAAEPSRTPTMVNTCATIGFTDPSLPALRTTQALIQRQTDADPNRRHRAAPRPMWCSRHARTCRCECGGWWPDGT